MSHFEQRKFIEVISHELKKIEGFDNMSVLDVGSYDGGWGSTKSNFVKNEYLGVDLAAGPNVDVVLDGSRLDKLNKKFDIIISCECFEHAENWVSIFRSMYETCKNNGFVIFTCASRGRIEHGTSRTINSDSPGTNDTYYNNIFKSHFEKKFILNDLFKNFELFYNIKSSDLYFIGQKGENCSLNFKEINRQIKKIKNKERKVKIFRIILSYILNDRNYQNFTFLRRAIKEKFSKKQ